MGAEPRVRLVREPSGDEEIPEASLRGQCGGFRAAGIPAQGWAQRVKNFSYLAGPAVVQRDLEAFRQIVPFKRVAIVYHAVINEVIPDLPDRIRAQMAAAGIEIHGVPIHDRAAERSIADRPRTRPVYVAARDSAGARGVREAGARAHREETAQFFDERAPGSGGGDPGWDRTRGRRRAAGAPGSH
jgi:hypothetical protein